MFQCVRPLSGEGDGICGHLMKLHSMGKWFSGSNAKKHNLCCHSIITERASVLRKQSGAALLTANLRQVLPSRQIQTDSAGAQLLRSWMASAQTLNVQIMEFLVYSTTSQPFTVLECPYFSKFLQTANRQAQAPTRSGIRSFCELEYKLFSFFLQIEMKICHLFYNGAPFAQTLHDGGTLRDREKYQSLGLKYVQPYKLDKIAQLLVTAANKCTMKNLTVQELFGLPGVANAIYEMRVDADMLNFKPTNVAALFVPQEGSGKAPDVGRLFSNKFEKVAKMPITEVSSTAISDAAALSVAQYLQVGDWQEEFQTLTLAPTQRAQYIDGTLCQMHNLGKCIEWALGTLLRSKNKRPYHPFEAGRTMVKHANCIAKYFNYGSRGAYLKSVAKLIGGIPNHPHVNLNGTRVDAARRVLTHVVIVSGAVKVIQSSESEHDFPSDLSLDDKAWDFMAELEGLSNAMGKYVFLVQTEKSFSGPYRIVLYTSLLKLLDESGEGIPILVRPVKAVHGPVREKVKHSEFSENGQVAWARAKSELHFRMVKQELTVNEVTALLGDIRLAKSQRRFLSDAMNLGLSKADIFDDVLSDFQRYLNNIHEFKKTINPSLVENSDDGEPSNSGDSDDTYDSDDLLVFDAPRGTRTSAVVEPNRPSEIAKRFFKTIASESRHIEWNSWLKKTKQKQILSASGVLKKEEEITELDLLDIDISPYYVNLIRCNAETADAVSFIMSRLSMNLAESFNERQLHVCAQIMRPERTAIKPDLMEWLALLRMNRVWMEARKCAFKNLLPFLNLNENEGLEIL